MFKEKLMLKIGCGLIFCAVAGGLAAVPNPVVTRRFTRVVKLEQVAKIPKTALAQLKRQ